MIGYRCEHHATTGHPTFFAVNFLFSVMPIQWSRNFVRWMWHHTYMQHLLMLSLKNVNMTHMKPTFHFLFHNFSQWSIWT